MKQTNLINIPPTSNIEELRKSIITELQWLLNTKDKKSQEFDGSLYVSQKEFDSELQTLISANKTSPLWAKAETHAKRLITTTSIFGLGATWWETDRTVSYVLTPTFVWKYSSGIYKDTLANIPTDLSTDDVGFLFYVTDYAHVLIWSGSAWGFGPGDSFDAGHIGFFTGVMSTGWKLLDGTGDDGSAIGAAHPIKILVSDGTTRDITTLDALDGYLKGAAGFSGSLTASTTPTISGSVDSGVAAIGNNNNAQAVQSGTGVSVAAHTHVHTDSGHIHGTSALSVDISSGDPIPYMAAIPYIRK